MFKITNDFITLEYMINSKMIIVYFDNGDMEERTITKKDLDKVWRKITLTFTEDTTIEDIEGIYDEFYIKTTGRREIED